MNIGVASGPITPWPWASPGAIARWSKSTRADPGQHVADDGVGALAGATGRDDEVGADELVLDRVDQPARIVRDDADAEGDRAGLLGLDGQDVEFASNTWPGSGCVPGSTSASPVDSTTTRGRGRTVAARTPDGGEQPEVPAPISSPARIAASPSRTSVPTRLDAAVRTGARRDEERARAKERILSFRDEFGQWDPRAQRPEPWSLYNGRIKKGEQVRVFPLSNWTELDIWRYIELEASSCRRSTSPTSARCSSATASCSRCRSTSSPAGGETASVEWVRYRTVGDLTITGAVRSQRHRHRAA